MLNEAKDVRTVVMERGSLLSCSNPSSACMARIKEARSMNCKEYAVKNGLDNHSTMALLKQSMKIQREIMKMGPIDKWKGGGVTNAQKVLNNIKRLGGTVEMTYDTPSELADAAEKY